MFEKYDYNALLYLFVSNIRQADNHPVLFQSGPRETMNLRIQSRDFTLIDGVRQLVVAHLVQAMNRGQDAITRIPAFSMARTAKSSSRSCQRRLLQRHNHED